jgi:hypothetical protein
MSNYLKVIIATICAGLLIWLFIEPQSAQDRMNQLSRAFKEGRIGALAGKEQSAFSKEILALCKIAGVRQRIEINTVPEPGKEFTSSLHFYVSNGAAEITRCTKGNAVYDAQLNCIFIDVNLIRANDWMIYQDGIQLNSGDLPFLNTYRKFIILHELGHYKLHGTSGGYFDLRNKFLSDESRQKELEADNFAIGSWAKYLANNEQDEDLGSSIDLRPDPGNTAEKSSVALLEMGNNIVLGMTYGLSPYSPFYSDAAHPTYLDRTKGMVLAIARQNNISEKIRARAEMIYASLDRTQQIAGNEDISEMVCEDPLKDLQFDNVGLIIFPDQKGIFYKFPYDALRKFKKTGDFKSYSISKAYLKQTNLAVDPDAKLTIFSFTGGQTFCAVDNTLYELTSHGFVDRSATSFGKLFKGYSNVYLPPQPGDKAIIVADSSFYFVKGPNQIVKKDISSIERGVYSQLKLKGRLNFFETLLNDDYAAVPLINDSAYNKIQGIAIIHFPDLSIDVIRDFNLPDKFFDNGDLGSTGYNNSENHFLYRINPHEGFVLKLAKDDRVCTDWQLWLCNQPARQEASFPFLSKQLIHRKGLNDYSPSMYHQQVTCLGKNQFILNWNGDSVFLIDTDKKTAVPIFNTGDEQLKIRVSQNGYIAFFIPGVRKFYLLKLS